MNIFYAQPPEEQRRGGLELAVKGWAEALRNLGHAVALLESTDLPPDSLVHFHGLWQPSHSSCAKTLKQKNIPYVVSIHGMLEPWAWNHKWWKKWPYFVFREQGYLKNATRLLAASGLEKNNLEGFFPAEQIITLPLGVVNAQYPGYQTSRGDLSWLAEEKVILFLSRLDPKKGVHLLLESLIRHPLPGSLRLVIVGKGDAAYEIKLRQQAQSLPASIRVDWVGEEWGPKKWRYLQGADLLCLPSFSENFGYAILEALQVGTPVLTTRNTPWSEYARPGIQTVVPDVADLSQGLKKWNEARPWTEKDRTELSQWANENFLWNQLAPRYVELYQSLLIR